ncbi:uncharacterized protein LOC143186725 [Calliopsis andreniformis]|uniref:uncharacterized protein LOC143186725 n=1 Tax=Calliopsis andreniformis TaxID=337506 RepID=UPI003FCE51C5
MIIESLDEYLETVAGFLFDNDKLVTYKWLSKELEIHVNIAKHVLWEFWQRHKKEKSFDCTFLLMGLLHDGGMRVEVVKETDLSIAKEKFTKILSEHIYSLQKVLPEIQVLGLSDNGDIKFSAIKCLENNERSDEEMHTLRWGTISTEIPCVSEDVPNNKSISLEKEFESIQKEKVKSPEKKLINSKKSTQKKGFDNLFGRMNNKQKSPSSMSSTIEKMKVDTSNHTKQLSSKESIPESSKKTTREGDLNSFLQGKNHEKNMNLESPGEKKNTISTVKENVEKKIVLEKDIKQKKNTRGKKRNRSKETNNFAKKHKRIKQLSDSSNEELSDEERAEEIESPSPETHSPVKVQSPPPRNKFEDGKRKILKMVDKTFEEDGYLVTKKEHVYESCSEDETEVVEQPKKSVTPEARPEIKGKKSTKQTTLMNFFKKS